jgi:uncharacterized membrane protein
MEKIVPINRGMFLKSYCDAGNIGRGPEEVFLVVGAILFMGFFPSILSAYGGVVPLFTFSGIELAGVAWGLARYFRQSEQSSLFLDTGRSGTRNPTGADDAEDDSMGEAA